ncbi:MAG: ATP-binding protein [Saccharospirillaceae bacterium]|nr:ATP-binding protein [Saccharospirillaceae bacterium]MCD8533145.1 ATP-binding protein [Saccharospirillaceae bacterium]
MSAFHWRTVSGRRLLLSVFLCIAVLTLLSVTITGYVDYRNEARNHETLLQQIEKGYLPAIARSVWTFDVPQIEFQLQALAHFTFIRYAVLNTGNGDDYFAGERPDDIGREAGWLREFDLYYDDGSGNRLVGQLQLQLDSSAALQQVMADIPQVLSMHFINILIVAVLLLIFLNQHFRRYFSQHLQKIADWAEHRDPKKRMEFEAEEDRELNQAISALNHMMEILNKNRHEQVENEKMAQLGNLVAGVAHELNTPLGICVTARSYIEDSVLLIQQRIKEGKLDKNTFSEQINNISEGLLLIDENLNRSHRLVRTFKSLAVDEESDFRSRFLLDEFLQEFSGNNEDFIVEEYRCRIDCNLSEPVMMNTCHQTLELVIRALIGNSLDHGYPQGGDIHIQMHAMVDVAANLLTLVYEDDGIGISDEVRQHIFEPFFTTGRSRGKTGLGMHLAYNLVTRILHGTIEVRERRQGAGNQGAEIHLRIPLDLDRYEH